MGEEKLQKRQPIKSNDESEQSTSLSAYKKYLVFQFLF